MEHGAADGRRFHVHPTHPATGSTTGCREEVEFVDELARFRIPEHVIHQNKLIIRGEHTACDKASNLKHGRKHRWRDIMAKERLEQQNVTPKDTTGRLREMSTI